MTGGSSQRRSRRAAEGVAIAAVRLLGTRPRRSARSPSTWLRGSSLVSRFRRALRPLLASSNENGSRRTRTHYGSRDARPHRRGPPAAVRQGATLRSRRGRPGSQGSSSPRVPAGARACTATAFRSTRSTSRGRRASSTSRRGRRARRRDQPEHAVLLPLARLAGAQPRRAEVSLGLGRLGARRRVQSDISSPRSTAKREPLEPTVVDDGTIVSTRRDLVRRVSDRSAAGPGPGRRDPLPGGSRSVRKPSSGPGRSSRRTCRRVWSSSGARCRRSAG